MSDNIPFDIQMDIMNRLPVKSLLQFCTVSKQWKFSIDNFNFIHENLPFRHIDSNLNIISLTPVASSEERKNQGTVTRIKTDEKGVFEMLFIAIGASIHTFMHCLRPLLIIDATHLKGQYKGTNLVAMGMDRNNQIVQIAFGICKGETGPCWSWWMSILKECIAFHAAYTPEEFSTEMSKLQAIQPDAYHKLIEVDPQRWSKEQCPLVCYNYMTSNSVESVNACTVLYRKVLVLKLAETYRAMVQEWYIKRRELANNMTSEITEWVANKVNKKRMKSATWIIYGVNHYQYQVSDERYNLPIVIVNPIWEVIQNGNGPISITTDTQGQIKVLPLRTAEEILVRERERKARTTLLMALPEDHLAKFHKMTDAKEMKKEESKALVTIDREGVDWTTHSEEEEYYALMACNSSVSDTEREQISNASIEIKAYTQGLKKVEAQLVAHQQGQLWYEEKIRYDGILSYENEVLQSVFMNKESELEKQPLYDRFVTAGGMHVVPPPMTGNYMPSGPDVEIDYSQFTYGPKQSQPSESETQTSDFDTCESDCSVETHESLPEPTVNEPKVVNQPKVWSDAPIIEEYESDSEDEHVSQPTKEQEQPSFASTNKQVKTPRETVKNQFTHSKNPTVDKKGLGYGFTARACFVCGSLSHLIRDCDFHEKRMAKQAELNNSMRKKSSQREIRPIWHNVQRVNHKNQYVPTAVLTRTGKILVNTARASGTNNVSTARHHFNRQAVPTNAAMKVNTVRPIMNRLVLLGEKGKLLLSPQQVVIGDKKDIHKDTTGTKSPNTMVDQAHDWKQGLPCREYQDFNGGLLLLEDVRLHNLVKICDKKNKVLFTDSECLVLSPEFMLPDENQATIDESNKWHRRLGHVNFKNLNKLVKGNLVRGLPSKIFQNDHTCVAYQKGKQHKASYTAKLVSSISQPLQLLHMDLFGPTS
ncbi:putative ribonuclease H-like domain-containing protein, partial [Tanacetum coccineum]